MEGDFVSPVPICLDRSLNLGPSQSYRSTSIDSLDSHIGAMGWAVQSAVRQKQESQRLFSEQKRQQYFEFLDS